MSTSIDIIKFCASTVGDISDEMIEFGRQALRLKYKTLYDAHLWRESLRMIYSKLDPDLGGVFFLPYDAEEVIFFSISWDGLNFIRMEYRERDWMESYTSGGIGVSGTVPYYYRAENLGWPYFGPGQFTFTCYDTGIFTLFIAGTEVGTGNMVNETFKVQAIVNPGDQSINPAVITTTHSYDRITALSKGITNKPLVIQPQFPLGGASISMPPGQSELIFTQLVLAPSPVLQDSSNNPLQVPVRLQVKLKADVLGSDFSVPRISHIMESLTEFVLSAMYKKSRQLSKSDNCEQKAIAHLQAAVQVEKNQSEMHQQVVPVIYERGDYVASVAGASSSYPWGW